MTPIYMAVKCERLGSDASSNDRLAGLQIILILAVLSDHVRRSSIPARIFAIELDGSDAAGTYSLSDHRPMIQVLFQFVDVLLQGPLARLVEQIVLDPTGATDLAQRNFSAKFVSGGQFEHQKLLPERGAAMQLEADSARPERDSCYGEPLDFPQPHVRVLRVRRMEPFHRGENGR